VTEIEPVSGVVSTWNDDEGWGVLASQRTPGGCWCHFSALAMEGFRTLSPGTSVEFLYEVAEQDGYNFRAVEAWPVGQRHRAPESEFEGGESFSTITIHVDTEDATD
jgi:CspA family cold shock protein